MVNEEIPERIKIRFRYSAFNTVLIDDVDTGEGGWKLDEKEKNLFAFAGFRVMLRERNYVLDKDVSKMEDGYPYRKLEYMLDDYLID